MDKASVVVSIVVTLVVGVVLSAIVGLTYLNAQHGKEKTQQQYLSCINRGGSYIKQVGGEPICLNK